MSVRICTCRNPSLINLVVGQKGVNGMILPRRYAFTKGLSSWYNYWSSYYTKEHN